MSNVLLFDEPLTRWQQFHQANPKVYKMFCGIAKRMVKNGYRRLSARMIIEYIRADHMLQTVSHDEWKINNNYVAFYARKFVLDHPEYAQYFEFRTGKHVTAI